MPYTSEWVEPEVFFEHGGVTVYHVYKHDELSDGPRGDQFTVDPDEGCYDDVHDPDKPRTFRIEDLPPPATGTSLADHPEFIGSDAAAARGIRHDQWCEHPDYKVLATAWEVWHDDIRPKVIKAMLAQAIDNGWLTQEGGFDAERAKTPPMVTVVGVTGDLVPVAERAPDPGMSVVSWCIDVETEDPIEAARKALRIHRKPDSIATVFRVVSSDGKIYDVDLTPEHTWWRGTSTQSPR